MVLISALLLPKEGMVVLARMALPDKVVVAAPQEVEVEVVLPQAARVALAYQLVITAPKLPHSQEQELLVPAVETPAKQVPLPDLQLLTVALVQVVPLTQVVVQAPLLRQRMAMEGMEQDLMLAADLALVKAELRGLLFFPILTLLSLILL
jgi:hypothetical protein